LTPDSSCKRPDPPRRDGSGAGHNALRAVLGSCPGLHLHLAAGVCMSITTYLDDFDADLETKTVLGVALERARVSLGLDKFANGIIARRIIEIAKTGERNPDLLCEGALKKLRGHLYSD